MLAKCGGAQLIFSCGGVLRTRSTEHQYMIWQTYKKRIYAAGNNVIEQMIHNTWVEVDYWLSISRVTNGTHVEVYGT